MALPPGLEGYIAAQQLARQQENSNFGRAQGILGMQSMLDQRNLQRQLFEQKAQADQQRQAAMAQYAQQLPEQDRTAFMAAPDLFLKERLSGYTLKPGEARMVGGNQVSSLPSLPTRTDVAVPGQPGVSQAMWLRPGDTSGPAIGGMKMPDILNPDVEAARARIAASGATRVSVDNRAEGAYAQKVAGGAADVDASQVSAAQAAVDNVSKLNTVLNQLKTSDAITGMGSDVLRSVERARVLFTNSEKAGKRVADTELLDAMLGSDVFPMIKALGIGARGMDTPAEREFLRSVMTGTTAMNKNTLIKMTEIRRDIAKRAIDQYNERVDSGELDRYFRFSGQQKKKLDVPQSDGSKVIDFGSLR